MTIEAPFFQEPAGKIYLGNCLDILPELPEGSVDCIVTSPPYWGLRQYKIDPLIWGGNKNCEHEWGTPGGHICLKCSARLEPYGLEKKMKDYIEDTVPIFREIKRVLSDYGTCWLNIGDSMAVSGIPGGDFRDGKGGDDYLRPYDRNDLEPLNTCLIPFRMAIALQEDGWIIRSTIVWVKPAPMPESVRGVRWERHKIKIRDNRGPLNIWQDCRGCPKCAPNDGYVLRWGHWRPTRAWELILMMAKSEKGFSDGEDLRENFCNGRLGNPKGGGNYARNVFDKGQEGLKSGIWERGNIIGGRNIRNVWEIGPEPFKGAHFAVFPTELPRRCILAGTSDKGYCVKCGAPWARVVEIHSMVINRSERNKESNIRILSSGTMVKPSECKTLSWRPTCQCNAGFRPGIVLDPFAGACTTGIAAKQIGRHYICIDMSEKYCAMGIKRLEKIPLALEYGNRNDP